MGHVRDGNPYGLASSFAKASEDKSEASAPRVAIPICVDPRFVFRLRLCVGFSLQVSRRVKPSGVQGSEPTPWWTKKRPVGSYFSLMAFNRA